MADSAAGNDKRSGMSCWVTFCCAVQDNRPKALKRAQKRLAQTFGMTKFAEAAMVPMTAKQGACAHVVKMISHRAHTSLIHLSTAFICVVHAPE